MTTPLDIILVPAGTKDAGRLVPIYRDCEAFLRQATQARVDQAMVRQDMATSDREGGSFFTVLVSGSIAGVADLIPSGYHGDAGTGFITLLMLGKAWRGRGIGQLVVELMEEMIQSEPGVREIQLAVQTNNPAGAGFWEHMGYQRYTDPALQMDGTTTCLYRKKISDLS